MTAYGVSLKKTHQGKTQAVISHGFFSFRTHFDNSNTGVSLHAYLGNVSSLWPHRGCSSGPGFEHLSSPNPLTVSKWFCEML